MTGRLRALVRRQTPRRGSRRHRGEGGYAAVLVAVSFATFLIPITALSVDVGRWYVEIEHVQNAADAAATAGVTYLPDDLPKAIATAKQISARNGYPDSGSTSVQVEVGAKPSQLKVTVSSTIHNSFAGYFDKDFTTISRSAVADYNGPAPMGSPCNSYGNEPPGSSILTGTEQEVRGPVGSEIVAPPGGATCTSNPQFWGAIAGPETPKGNGDAYATRKCDSGNSSCTGGVNTEFDPLGYFYILRVGAAAVGTSVTVQIYDPAMVEVGDACGSGPKADSGNPFRNDHNPFVTDGATRYAGGLAGSFCNGDVVNGGSGTDFVTSYVVREPTDTYVPKNGTPITSCARQYQGYATSNTTSNRLDSGKTQYNAEVAKVFRQWVKLCSFTPTKAGDYYLQIRQNVKLGGITDGEGGYKNNANVYTQMGDDTTVKGTGNNRFALRVKGTARGSVSISGYDHMGVYANYSGAVTTFNLVRVVPAAANKTLRIGFFDVGDATQPGTLTIKPPSDSNLPASIVGCIAGGNVVTGALAGCKLTNVYSTYNGKWQFVNVPIPNGYTCVYQQSGGCWFKVEFAFPGGVPSDTTTWMARIDGDPVRLVD